MLHDRSALGRLVGSRLLAQRRIALLLRYGDDPASAAGLLEDRAEAAGEVGRRSVGDAQLDPPRLVAHQMHVVHQMVGEDALALLAHQRDRRREALRHLEAARLRDRLLLRLFVQRLFGLRQRCGSRKRRAGPGLASGRRIHLIAAARLDRRAAIRSEEHTSELQSLMRISYAVFCLKKKKQSKNTNTNS